MKRIAALVAAVLGVAALTGAASAGFLAALAAVTRARQAHPAMVQLLPLTGLLSVWLYRRLAPAAERGHALVLDEIHAEAAGAAPVPPAMGPLVFAATLLAHAGGGSVGREGTAVQMGAAAAAQAARSLKLPDEHRRALLLAGMSAGFAAVFGTPWAGAVFGLEVVGVGALHWRRLREVRFWKALPLCALAAFAADALVRGLGIRHETYDAGPIPPWTIPTLGLVAVAALPFAAAARAFTAALRGAGHAFARALPDPYARVAGGGALVASLAWLTGPAYLGLGLERTLDAFQVPAAAWDPLAKTAFTALTLGSGFRGGEVTPLFFVGATLGSALSLLIPLSTSVLAALGFAAVFAGAANTPWTCVLLAMELFGARIGPGAVLACGLTYLLSSHRGIYEGQRIFRRKPRPRLR